MIEDCLADEKQFSNRYSKFLQLDQILKQFPKLKNEHLEIKNITIYIKIKKDKK